MKQPRGEDGAAGTILAASQDEQASRSRPGARVAERRQRVAELYPELRPKAIADVLGVSHSLVRLDLKAMGIETVPQWEPRAHVTCSLAGCDHPVLHDFPSAVAKGRGRFCSREHAYADRRRRTLVTVTCKQCGRHRELPQYEARKHPDFCSNECTGRYGVEHGTRAALLTSMHDRGLLRGRRAQELLGKVGARKPPAPGGRRRGRPAATATPEQVVEIGKLAAAGWGRRAIATRLRLSERLVRNVLGV